MTYHVRMGAVLVIHSFFNGVKSVNTYCGWCHTNLAVARQCCYANYINKKNVMGYVYYFCLVAMQGDDDQRRISCHGASATIVSFVT